MDDGQIETGVYGDIEDHNGKVTEPHHGKSLFCVCVDIILFSVLTIIEVA